MELCHYDYCCGSSVDSANGDDGVVDDALCLARVARYIKLALKQRTMTVRQGCYAHGEEA